MREKERVRVRMLLGPIAHAVGYKMMVGAHNTVCVRRMWEVLPYSPCMANDDVYNTVNAQRHVGGFYRVRLVWELMTPITL